MEFIEAIIDGFAEIKEEGGLAEFAVTTLVLLTITFVALPIAAIITAVCGFYTIIFIIYTFLNLVSYTLNQFGNEE